MLGYFPRPHPEELFYSICARAADRLQFPRQYGLMDQLFGNRSVRANVVFPFRLDAFISNLPPGHSYTAEGIIENHTLLRFYEPFWPSDRGARLRLLARGNAKSTIGIAAASGRAAIASPKNLRCCPCCDTEDESAFGERFWHRLPQIAGVEVCPKHAVFLNTTAALRMKHRPSSRFFSAESVYDRQPARPINPSNDQHRLLLALAKDADWLLRKNTTFAGSTRIRQMNVDLLVANGYATPGGYLINAAALHEAFECRFSKRTLATLQSELGPDVQRTWLRNIVRQRIRATQTIQQLLFIHFFDLTAESFLLKTLNTVPKDRSGPWPCLNPVCAKHRQLVIRAVKREQNNTVGVFSCSFCCFTYSRPLARLDIYETHRVKYRGWLWDREFRKLMNDPTVPLPQIYGRLGAGHSALSLYAQKKQVPMRSARRSKLRHPWKRRVDPALRKERRKQWLEARRDHPEMGVTQLRLLISNVFAFLWSHDREWFNKHKPANAKKKRSRAIDWTARDRDFAVRIPKIAAKLKSDKRLISMTAVSARLGFNLMSRNLALMPSAKRALASVLETDIPTWER